LHYGRTKAWVTDNAIVARSRDDGDTRYWYFALQTLSLNGRSSGSGQPLLNQKILSGIAFTPPVREVRIAIAEVLGALDDKIAANTKLQANLESLADAEYIKTSRLSPSSATISELMSLEYGKPLATKDRVNGSYPIYGSGGIVGYHERPLIEGPGIVVGRKGTAGSVHWVGGAFYPIDTTFFVEVRPERTTPIYAYHLLRRAGLESLNSDSAVPGLNRHEAHAVKVTVPEISVITEFTRIASSLYETRAQLETESHTLAATRDALLPQLIAGKLRVKDAEALVANAV
jgi:type I restriction enzyme S subunit